MPARIWTTDMGIVKFASICDLCGVRGEEYSMFPSCRDCGADVCPKCCTDHDEEHGAATCNTCLAEVTDAMRAEAYTSGRAVGSRRGAFSLNPYDMKSQEWHEWARGWRSVQGEQLARYGDAAVLIVAVLAPLFVLAFGG